MIPLALDKTSAQFSTWEVKGWRWAAARDWSQTPSPVEHVCRPWWSSPFPLLLFLDNKTKTQGTRLPWGPKGGCPSEHRPAGAQVSVPRPPASSGLCPHRSPLWPTVQWVFQVGEGSSPDRLSLPLELCAALQQRAPCPQSQAGSQARATTQLQLLGASQSKEGSS